ncbi:MAG: hypothetical protein J2P57_13105, partial [Acidimicrobiaceae bacterium]|nr:hypothetical protein [Acidimicrobiaceae bacterium]
PSRSALPSTPTRHRWPATAVARSSTELIHPGHLVAPGRRARHPTIIALAVANTGNAIPFGLASGLHSNQVNAAEWTLSACYAIAAVALWVRVAGFTGRHAGWATLVTAALWSASAMYVGYLPGAVIRERVALVLIFGSLAIVAMFTHLAERADLAKVSGNLVRDV